MNLFFRSLSTRLNLVLKRLWAHRWLALCRWVGLVLGVALAVAIPLYADGVNFNILNASLSSAAERSGRGAFDFVFRYIGSWHGAVGAEDYRLVDVYLQEQAAPGIGLPVEQVTRYLGSANFQFYRSAETLDPAQRLDLVKLGFISGIFERVQLIEGQLPSESVPEGVLPEVLVSLELANELDLQVGQVYSLYQPPAGTLTAFRRDVLVSGIWTALDPEDDFWALYPAESFRKKLLLSEEAWWFSLSGLDTPLDEAAWRLTLDGSRVSSAGAAALLARIDAVQNRAASIMPHTDLETSPAAALRQFRRDSNALTGSLFAFSVPVLGLVLFFLSLVAGLSLRAQRNEIAVLRSRGSTRWGIIGLLGLDWGLLGAAALLVGTPLGVLLASWIGRTRSFLDFSNPLMFTPHLSWREGLFALGAVVLGILFGLLPAWVYGRDTIVSYKQERARTRRKALWQRIGLDGLCLLPALYGLYTLKAQGQLSLLGRTVGSTDPFQNPLLFVLPVLLVSGLTLLALRVFPQILNGLTQLAARFPGVLPLYVLRRFSRNGQTYQGSIMLMAFTLGLAVFSASMAYSLDQGLKDEAYYSIGADLNLVEGGEFVSEPLSGDSRQENSQEEQSGLWNFLPVTDHLSLSGVESAARVGVYDASLNSGGRSTQGSLTGIDRADFAAVAFFRDDFAPESLNALLNRLASAPEAVLVDQATWERFNLNTGDTLEIRASINDENFTVTCKAAGVFTYFPNWNPARDGALFVANLDYLFESWGVLQPYQVWLHTTTQADTAQIISGINQMGVAVIRTQDSRAEINTALTTPSRQGVVGLLSVGFLASAALTVVGFFLFAMFSFRERFIQLGVLRAIGLGEGQMRSALLAELAVLMAVGVGIGTLSGLTAAFAFIPVLPLNTGTTSVLPQVTRIAWGPLLRVYLLFAGTLLSGAALLLLSLRRLKIFQAIKLGETV